MADVIIRRTEELSGQISAPPSKAYTHRMTIAALLSNGITRIVNPLYSDDTQATLRAITAFGGGVNQHKNQWTIEGASPIISPNDPIDCGDSGSTLRFMIPVAALPKTGSSRFTLSMSLEKRPIIPLLQSLEQLGVKSIYQKQEENSSVAIQGGGLKGGKTTIRGDISSQFISGLMFACPMANEDTEINLTTPLESKSYVQMTEEILKKHAIKILTSKDFMQLQISSDQTFRPQNHKVPGDFSSAAFLLAAAAISPSKVKVKNLDSQTKQGDKTILNILTQMGSKIRVGDGYIEEANGRLLKSVNIDARDIPDLVPICAVLACYSRGSSVIYNAKRLRYKESDRLLSLHTELRKMGAKILMEEDSLIIKGPCEMHGAIIDPHNDHRIAMACTVAALGATGETTIQDFECVRKSYPTFFNDLQSLGANISWRQIR